MSFLHSTASITSCSFDGTEDKTHAVSADAATVRVDFLAMVVVPVVRGALVLRVLAPVVDMIGVAIARLGFLGAATRLALKILATRLAEPTAVEPARGMRLLGAAVVAMVEAEAEAA